jgi:hypothetical protein
MIRRAFAADRPVGRSPAGGLTPAHRRPPRPETMDAREYDGFEYAGIPGY